MSTYSTIDGEVLGTMSDQPAASYLEQVLRCSVDLATGDIGLDVETRTKATGACRHYERIVLTPDAARDFARLLNLAADRGDRHR